MDGVSVRSIALHELEGRVATLSTDLEEAKEDCQRGIDSGRRAYHEQLARTQRVLQDDIAEMKAYIVAMREPRDVVGAGCVVTIKQGSKCKQFAIMRITTNVTVKKGTQTVMVLGDTNTIALKLRFKRVGSQVKLYLDGEESYWTISKIE